MRYYAFGTTPTANNTNARHQAAIHGTITKRTEVARRMFQLRFGDLDISDKTIEQLRGMEGKRIKALYQDLGARHGVTWKGRNYDTSNWQLSDNLNRSVSAANAALYALTTAVVGSLGYLPQLGFIHASGTLPFVFDIADLYKPETTLPAAFQTIALKPEADEKDTIKALKKLVESTRLLNRMPKDIQQLLDFPKPPPRARAKIVRKGPPS